MPQLSDTSKRADGPPVSLATSSTKGQALSDPPNETSATRTRLGYELLNGRNPRYVQVPLSVSNSRLPQSYTGSALLDSFVRDRSSETVALRNLRLVNVSNRSISNRPVSDRASISDPAVESAPVDQTVIESEPTDAQKPSEVEASDEAQQLAKSQKLAEAQKLAEFQKLAEAQQPDTLHEPAETHIASSASSTAQRAPERVLENPPPVADQTKTDMPPQAVRQKAAPAPAPSVPVRPQVAPTLPVRSPAFSTVAADYDRQARDGAASVGLIDVTDTLLFGGERADLLAEDPFVSDGGDAAQSSLLSYLSQQVSAFTVGQLQSGFPHNTDPNVLHRPDPPKHKTVLSIQSFRLGQLDLDDKSATASANGNGSSQTPVNSPGNNSPRNPLGNKEIADIYELNQQVNDLNRKIAMLTEKLAKVSDLPTAG